MNETQSPPTKITRKDVFDRLKESTTVIQLILTVTSVVIVIAALWISSLLQPLKQDTALIQQQVDAQEQRIDELKDSLNRIERKLDDLIRSL